MLNPLRIFHTVLMIAAVLLTAAFFVSHMYTDVEQLKLQETKNEATRNEVIKLKAIVTTLLNSGMKASHE